MSEKEKEISANDAFAELYGIFGQKPDDVVLTDTTDDGNKIPLFSPDPNLSEDKIWRGVISFKPNIADMQHPLVKKVQYWLTDPRDNNGFRFDSPKSLGKYESCPVADKYWDWTEKGKKDPRYKKMVGALQYNRKCFTLIQVIKDFQNHDNDGKFFVFNVPVKVQKMINMLMYPAEKDIEMGAKPRNVFEPITGVPMQFKLGFKTIMGHDGKPRQVRDWDTALEWVDGKPNAGFILEDGTHIKELPDNKEGSVSVMTTIIKTLKNAEICPQINEFAYKGANEKLLARVKETLAAIEGAPINAETVADTKTETVADTKTETVADTKTGSAVNTNEKSSAEKSSDDIANDVANELGLG